MALAGEKHGVEAVDRLAQRHPGLVVAARVGWVAKGLVYGIVGFLAFRIAFNPFEAGGGEAASSEDEASQAGAVRTIAETTGGTVLLWAVAAGLALFVVWLVMSMLMPADGSARSWVIRVAYGASAIVYAGLALTAVSFAVEGDNGDAVGENGRVENITRDVMDTVGGRWVVGAVGAAIVAIGIAFVFRAITARFAREIDGGWGPLSEQRIVQIGRIGWFGRGAMLALVGAFVIRAAVQFDPSEAQGLDGALRSVAESSWGTVAVAAVGVGLMVYGLYCLLSAPVQRLEGAR